MAGQGAVNIVAAAVRIAGGAARVAETLRVSRSQVYRWINARTMAHATYVHVATLSTLSGIETRFLGGNGLDISQVSSQTQNGLTTGINGQARSIKPGRKNESLERGAEL